MSEDQVTISKPLRRADDPLLDQVEKTYTGSFPEEERRDFALVRELVEADPRFELYVLSRDGKYVGFLTGWQFDGFVYAEHFAIDPSARNGGIGAKAMRLFLALHDDPVVLEVELPEDEMSRRRIGFYERLGFTLDHHVYFQPPYRAGEKGLEMRLMAHGALDLDRSFDKVKAIIHRNVYGVNNPS